MGRGSTTSRKTSRSPFVRETINQLEPMPIVKPSIVQDWQSLNNFVANIDGGLMCTATREEIQELRRQGIEVGSINEPAPKNNQLQVEVEAPPHGTWEKLSYCCHQANADFTNQLGQFIHCQWDVIVEDNELKLFCMCFPKQWLLDVLIPIRDEQGPWEEDESPRILCIFGMHLLHGMV